MVGWRPPVLLFLSFFLPLLLVKYWEKKLWRQTHTQVRRSQQWRSTELCSTERLRLALGSGKQKRGTFVSEEWHLQVIGKAQPLIPAALASK